MLISYGGTGLSMRQSIHISPPAVYFRKVDTGLRCVRPYNLKVAIPGGCCG